MDSKQQPQTSSSTTNSFESNNFQQFPRVLSISLNQLFTLKGQPRRYFDEEATQELAASIKKNGILQPLLVRPMGDKYEIVAGKRRYKAARIAGLTEVPVTVREMTDEQAVQYALVENLQRKNLNPVEETEGILQLLEMNLKIDQKGVISLLNQMANKKRGFTDNVVRTQEEVVEATLQTVGNLSPESLRTHRLPILKLPHEILEALRQGRIEYTKAKAIAKLKVESERQTLLEEAIAESLSLKQIRERIRATKLSTEKEELQTRMEAIPKKIKKLKAWDDPDKRSQIESLLKELEALLSEDKL